MRAVRNIDVPNSCKIIQGALDPILNIICFFPKSNSKFTMTPQTDKEIYHSLLDVISRPSQFIAFQFNSNVSNNPKKFNRKKNTFLGYGLT